MSKNNSSEPTFDYSNYSRAAQVSLMDQQLDLQYLAAQIDGASGTMTRAEYNALRQEFRALTEAIDEALLAYVTHVPRDWFVSSAPDGITVATPQWWLQVRADRLQEIKRLAAEARTPEKVSGE